MITVAKLPMITYSNIKKFKHLHKVINPLIKEQELAALQHQLRPSLQECATSAKLNHKRYFGDELSLENALKRLKFLIIGLIFFSLFASLPRSFV